MTMIANLEVTVDEVDLIESSIRTQIDRLSQVEQGDSCVDALKKHKKIFELITLLRKMQQHQCSIRFDSACPETYLKSLTLNERE